MKRVTLYLSAMQYDEFQVLATKSGRPYSELVRDALDRYLEERAEKKTASRRGRTRRKA